MSTSCFLKGLTASQAAHLDNNGCMCIPMQHGDETGYMVAEADMSRALHLLDCGIAGQEPSHRYEGVTCVDLSWKGQPGKKTSPGPFGQGHGDLSALNAVLQQVRDLQKQVNLTEPERVERLRLQGEVQSRQQELEAATQRLRATVQICQQTDSRVQSISLMAAALADEMKSLPEGLQEHCQAVTGTIAELGLKLEELSASCLNDQSAARQCVSERKNELQAAKDALNADIAKHRLSAEDTLAIANATILDAEQCTATAEDK